MDKIIKISDILEKEEKLQQIADYMEVPDKKLDALTEALDALEDAYDMVDEVVTDEM